MGLFEEILSKNDADAFLRVHPYWNLSVKFFYKESLRKNVVQLRRYGPHKEPPLILYVIEV